MDVQLNQFDKILNEGGGMVAGGGVGGINNTGMRVNMIEKFNNNKNKCFAITITILIMMIVINPPFTRNNFLNILIYLIIAIVCTMIIMN